MNVCMPHNPIHLRKYLRFLNEIASKEQTLRSDLRIIFVIEIMDL